MAEWVVIGGIAVLPILTLMDAGSIKAPCQPEPRKDAPRTVALEPSSLRGSQGPPCMP